MTEPVRGDFKPASRQSLARAGLVRRVALRISGKPAKQWCQLCSSSSVSISLS